MDKEIKTELEVFCEKYPFTSLRSALKGFEAKRGLEYTIRTLEHRLKDLKKTLKQEVE